MNDAKTPSFSSGEETPIPTGCKPTFTERPTIRQVEEGKITFECRLVGEPRPDVRDGSVLGDVGVYFEKTLKHVKNSQSLNEKRLVIGCVTRG